MATYSPNLALALLANAEGGGTWGQTTNTNLGTLVEQAISGYAVQSIPDSNVTITIPNGATGVARNMYIECTGILTAQRQLIVPANPKLYFIYNNTTGGFAIQVLVSGQTGITIPAGARAALVCNGFDIFPASGFFGAVDINGGTIDNTPIGAATPSTGSFTNVNVTSTTIPANGIYQPSGNTLGAASGSVLRWFVNNNGLHTFAAPSGAGPTLVVNAQAINTTNAIQLPTAGSMITFARSADGGLAGFIGSRAGTNNYSFYNTGGVGAELELTGGGVVNLYTNALARFAIGSGGNVTINAPASGNTLTVFGNANGTFSWTSAATSGYNVSSVTNDTGFLLGHNSNTRTFELQTNNVSRIVIAGTGAVTVVGSFAVNNATPPAQVTGFGTPTGSGVIANFPGASASLNQCSNTIAEILLIMKQYGFIGA